MSAPAYLLEVHMFSNVLTLFGKHGNTYAGLVSLPGLEAVPNASNTGYIVRVGSNDDAYADCRNNRLPVHRKVSGERGERLSKISRRKQGVECEVPGVLDTKLIVTGQGNAFFGESADWPGPAPDYPTEAYVLLISDVELTDVLLPAGSEVISVGYNRWDGGVNRCQLIKLPANNGVSISLKSRNGTRRTWRVNYDGREVEAKPLQV